MRLQGKSAKQAEVGIAEYYAINVGSIWRGLKQHGGAFWWFCIYFFFEYVRPQTLYPAIGVIPWAQLSLLLACLSAFADHNVKWVSNPGNFLFILFISIVLLSSVFAFHPATAWDGIDVIVNWVFVYFLIITVVNTEKRFLVFILLFFLVNFKMSQFGFRAFLSQGYSAWGVSGAPGWFRDSGDLGIQMTIFVSLSTAFALALRDYWGLYKKLFFYLLPVTGLITIIATTSRGAQLGMATAGLWFLIKSRKGIKAVFGILLAGWTLYALLPERMIAEFEQAGEDATSVQRLELWSYGIDVVVPRNPVLGVGYNNWLDYCWFINPGGIPKLNHCYAPHNTYIQAVSELGITGLTVYLLLIIFIFAINARTRINARQSNNTFLLFSAHGLDGGLIGYMISSFFFTVLYYPMFYVQLAMTVALYEISKKQLADSKARLKRADPGRGQLQKDFRTGNGLDTGA